MNTTAKGLPGGVFGPAIFALMLSVATPSERAHADASVSSQYAPYFSLIFDALRESGDQIPDEYREHLIAEAKRAQHDADSFNFCAAERVLAELRRDLSHRVRDDRDDDNDRSREDDHDRSLKGDDDRDKKPRQESSVASVLQAYILDIESLLLSQPESAGCGGANAPPSTVGAPVVSITSADNTQVTFHVSLPPPTFAPRTGNGAKFLEMFMPGMGNISSLLPIGDLARSPTTLGLPELPGLSQLIAVPQGGSLSVALVGSSSYQLPAVQVWPVQPPTAAAKMPGSPPSLGLPPAPTFTINKVFYSSANPYPSSLSAAGPVNSSHGLSAGSVALAGAQYAPADGQLRVFTAMDVRVSFGGDAANSFGTSRLFDSDNGAFQKLWRNSVINWASVAQYVIRVPFPRPCGEEMMIITTPALQSAADTFAADRTAHGILTNVFVTGSSANADQGDIGITPKGILAFIAQEYNRDCIRPAYVLLLGDTLQVPTFEISLGFHTNSDGSTSPNFFEDPVATDMPYGFVHQQAQVDQAILSSSEVTYYITDYNPDLFVGRLPAANLSQAVALVSMIEAYEDAAPAPTSSNFYQTVVGTEFFQPCPNIQANCRDSNGNIQTSTQDRQSFLRSSEFVGVEAQIAGKTFSRIAQDEENYDTGVTITPLTFDDGTAIPAGINFSGTTSDVINAIDNGAFLVWHSDHGATNGLGWYEPAFSENDNNANSLAALNEPAGQLPLIWSSDCDTGKFDTELLQTVPGEFPFVLPPTTNFGEQSLQLQKAVGFVGASRESPIYQDGFTLKGMGTNLFPEEGNIWRAFLGITLQIPVRQLGPLLLAAKQYMESETSADLVNDHGVQGTVLEYNLLGDPSMAIWRDPPKPLLGQLVSGLLDPLNAQILVRSGQQGVDGTLVTLISNGVTLGQGVFVNGVAVVPLSANMDSINGVTALLNNDGYLPVSVPLGAKISTAIP